MIAVCETVSRDQRLGYTPRTDRLFTVEEGVRRLVHEDRTCAITENLHVDVTRGDTTERSFTVVDVVDRSERPPQFTVAFHLRTGRTFTSPSVSFASLHGVIVVEAERRILCRRRGDDRFQFHVRHDTIKKQSVKEFRPDDMTAGSSTRLTVMLTHSARDGARMTGSRLRTNGTTDLVL